MGEKPGSGYKKDTDRAGQEERGDYCAGLKEQKNHEKHDVSHFKRRKGTTDHLLIFTLAPQDMLLLSQLSLSAISPS